MHNASIYSRCRSTSVAMICCSISTPSCACRSSIIISSIVVLLINNTWRFRNSKTLPITSWKWLIKEYPIPFASVSWVNEIVLNQVPDVHMWQAIFDFYRPPYWHRFPTVNNNWVDISNWSTIVRHLEWNNVCIASSCRHKCTECFWYQTEQQL